MILNQQFLYGSSDAQIMPQEGGLAIGCLEAGRSMTEMSENTKCDIRTVSNHPQCFKDTKVFVTSTDPEDLAERQ